MLWHDICSKGCYNWGKGCYKGIFQVRDAIKGDIWDKGCYNRIFAIQKPKLGGKYKFLLEHCVMKWAEGRNNSFKEAVSALLSWNSITSNGVTLFQNPAHRCHSKAEAAPECCIFLLLRLQSSHPEFEDRFWRLKLPRRAQIVSLSAVISGRFCLLSDGIKYLDSCRGCGARVNLMHTKQYK